MSTMTAAQVRAQTCPMEQVPDPEVPERPRPPRQYPAAYKLRGHAPLPPRPLRLLTDTGA